MFIYKYVAFFPVDYLFLYYDLSFSAIKLSKLALGLPIDHLHFYSERPLLLAIMQAQIEQLARDAAEIALKLPQSEEARPAIDAFLEQKLPRRPGYIWIIDPVEGTRNFSRGDPNWAISICHFDKENATPVFGVIYAPAFELMLSGGTDYEVKLNGKTLSTPKPAFISKGCAGIDLDNSFTIPEQMAVLEFFRRASPVNFRCTGSSCILLASLAQGQIDSYFALVDDVTSINAGLAILVALGFKYKITIESKATHNQRFRIACGGDDYLRSIDALMTSSA